MLYEQIPKIYGGLAAPWLADSILLIHVLPHFNFYLQTQKKARKPGDPFEYELPSDGKHWETIFEPLLDKDKAQCAAWKEELQNLVIFAGLFSSVLSAFVVQTYQSLQPDPNDHIIFLLSQIAGTSQLSNTSVVLTPPEFVPDSSSVRVNALWLISLVLSLTTVLIAIVASQWLTEHQQYPTSMPIMDKFALFNMRQEGLTKWHVPEILSLVPLLLLIALIFFLIGLIDFVAEFVKTVAIPVIIVICIPLTFIALTTSLPSFQLVWMSFSTLHATTDMPNQCPYKSTQSRVLFRLLTFSSTGFLVLLFPLMVLWSFPLHIIHAIRSGHERPPLLGIPFFIQRNSDNSHQKAYARICKFWKADSWLIFDKKWMQFRTSYMASMTFGTHHWAYYSNRGFPFDCARGVQKLQGRFYLDSYKDLSREIIALYHVIDDIQKHLHYNFGTTTVLMLQHMLYSPRDVKKELFSLSYSYYNQPGLCREETLFIFLSKFTYLPVGLISDHFLELHLRLLNYCFSRFRNEPFNSNTSVPAQLPVYFHKNLGDLSASLSLTFTNTDLLRTQYSNIIKLYFAYVMDSRIDDDALTNSFLVDLPSVIGYAARLQSREELPVILDILSTRLSHYLSESRSENIGMRSDILFLTSAFYGAETWHSKHDHPSMLRFTSTLKAYVEHRGSNLNENVRIKLRIPPLEVPNAQFGSWWFFMYHGRESSLAIKASKLQEQDGMLECPSLTK